MKEFRKTIQSYLDQRAKQDPQFAESYAKDGKSIVDCCNYIMRQAQKRGGASQFTNQHLNKQQYDNQHQSKQ